MKKVFLSTVLALAGLGLSACLPETDHIPKSQAVSVQAISATAKGFTVGSETATQTVYVFFDAQCPHCGHLWEAAKPLWPQVRFGWIPVGVLNKASTAQGATLLGADDPAKRMDEHEASLLARQGGITAGTVAPELRLAIDANTKLFNSFGAESIPYIVTVGADGKAVGTTGALNTAALAALLGVPFNPVASATPVVSTTPN